MAAGWGCSGVEEILALALQEGGGAVVVGKRTWGLYDF